MPEKKILEYVLFFWYNSIGGSCFFGFGVSYRPKMHLTPKAIERSSHMMYHYVSKTTERCAYI